MSRPLTRSQVLAHARVLGVDTDADAQTVRRAWRRAVKATHPDVAGDDATEAMARTNAAHEVLRDGVPAALAAAAPDVSSSTNSTSAGRRHPGATSSRTRGDSAFTDALLRELARKAAADRQRAKARSALPHCTRIPADLKRSLRLRGLRVLRARGYPFPLWFRLTDPVLRLLRKPRIPAFVLAPDQIDLESDKIVFRHAEPLPTGRVVVCLPRLGLRHGRLHETGGVGVTAFNVSPTSNREGRLPAGTTRNVFDGIPVALEMTFGVRHM